MGKGDRRSRRGKIYNGSHGKKRPGRVKKTVATRTQGPQPGQGQQPGRGRPR